jgi:hypothetical protein
MMRRRLLGIALIEIYRSQERECLALPRPIPDRLIEHQRALRESSGEALLSG